jgi:thiol-disulfide isomerase/thioredoxin
MRVPFDSIAAPLFPAKATWLNVTGTQASIIKRGTPMLVEFWDFCRPNSLRTRPYIQEWHERYQADGLRVIGVHSPGFEPSRDEDAVREAVERLGITHPVLLDTELAVWQEYENAGWPARYLFNGQARLFDFHYGEGAYVETELAIQELLGIDREPMQPVRPEDAPEVKLAAQTEDQPGAYSGLYEAGGVWVVVDGEGTVTANGGEGPGGVVVTVEQSGAYPVITHGRHTRTTLDLQLSEGLTCLATCFTPGRV